MSSFFSKSNMPSKDFLYNTENFSKKQNKANLIQIYFDLLGIMLKKNDSPRCACCGNPLISNEDITSNPILATKGFFSHKDLLVHQNDIDVIRFIQQHISYEHIFTTACGGTDHYANSVAMHPHCNYQKGAMIAVEAFNMDIDTLVYPSRGLGIHIYELIKDKKVRKLEDIPKYILNFDINNKSLYHQNDIFNKNLLK